jgi:two-component system sensor histidine kinase BaeS
MFQQIRGKLFVAIVGVNALLALLTYQVISWSFDRGFIDFLDRTDQARLQPLITGLAEEYGRHGSWDWIAGDRELWRQLRRRYFWTGGPAAADADADADDNALQSGVPAAGVEPLTFDPRLLLLDRDRQVIHGFPAVAERAELKPIRWQNDIVGYLGYLPRQALLESVNHVFAARQDRNFAVVALAMLAAAVLLAAGIAHWLSRPIRALAEGAQALTRGHYEVTIARHGNDELARLAEDFNTLARTLAANRQARQQWIADIAHELRTPLSVLKGEIEALQDGVRQADAAGLSSLAQEVAQLWRLVEDLRTLSMSDLGALNYHKQPLLLAELLEEIVDDHRLALQQAGIEVALNLSSDVRLMADEQRLTQLFTNLMQNTLRYTDAPGQLHISLQRQGRQIRLLWQDSAPAVGDQDLARLTDRLYRVDGSRDRASGGSGLGLAIARAIVEAHDGSMQAGQSPLGGLAWQMVFPVSAEAA